MPASYCPKKVLRSVRSKYADKEENDNRQGNPEFHQAGPEKLRNLRELSTALLVSPGDAFGRCSHRHDYFFKAENTVFDNEKQDEPPAPLEPGPNQGLRMVQGFAKCIHV
jgi:hypothetical protein